MNTPLNDYECGYCEDSGIDPKGKLCYVCIERQERGNDLAAMSHEPPRSQTNPPKEATQSDKELEQLYESSGLSQIAFNSNGRDFFPETIRELLEWRDKAIAEETNTALIELTRKIEKISNPRLIDRGNEDYFPETAEEFRIGYHSAIGQVVAIIEATLKANKGKSNG